MAFKKKGVGRIQAPENTAVIYQLVRGPYAPTLLPFPLKLETYCRMAKIPYLVDSTGRFSSHGKLPWMTYNGDVVEDSQLCIEYFNKKLGVDLNSHLSVEERAVSRLIQVLVDEHLFWTVAANRFILDKTFPTFLKKHFRFNSIVFWSFQKRVKKRCIKHGIGRHTEEEVMEMMMDCLTTLSNFLGAKRFMLGDKMCQADCSAFGMLAQVEWHMWNRKDLLKDNFLNLHEYCHRIKEELWPDWEECVKNE